MNAACHLGRAGHRDGRRRWPGLPATGMSTRSMTRTAASRAATSAWRSCSAPTAASAFRRPPRRHADHRRHRGHHPTGPQLPFSPGRVDPPGPAFNATRKSLAGEFRLHGSAVFVIANHCSSEDRRRPAVRPLQPPIRASELAALRQAQEVNDFVDELVAAGPRPPMSIVLGDHQRLRVLADRSSCSTGGVLTTLMDTLPKPERYSYVFDGNPRCWTRSWSSDPLFSSSPVDYRPGARQRRVRRPGLRPRPPGRSPRPAREAVTHLASQTPHVPGQVGQPAICHRAWSCYQGPLQTLTGQRPRGGSPGGVASLVLRRAAGR